MGTQIDSLDIQISTSVKQANQSLNALVTRLDKVNNSLRGINSTGLSNLALGVDRLSNSMQGFSQAKTSGFTKLATNLNQLNTVNTANFNTLAVGISNLSRSISGISANGDFTQIAELAKSFRGFGYKSVTSAITNMPLLADALKKMLATLSTAPRVSTNLIDITNALANLTHQGSRVGSTTSSLNRYFDSMYSGSTRAGKGIKSLAYYFGKFYANFWILRRGIGAMKNAIEYASDLVEVQNVVDTAFGDYRTKMEDFSSTSIQDFGLSELTAKQIGSRYQAMGIAMGFSQEAMSDMSIELTKLAGDMASFYNVEADVVAEDLESVFTGTTKPLRQYGLDLTQATLQEWALKNGMDANIDSMTQAEKMMLRYNYVLANTQMAQGDFQKTQLTWANQVKILKQQFQALGAVIGQVGINAFRPLLIGLNKVIAKVIEFAKVISNALGKIFGWEYQEGGGAIFDTGDVEDYGDALEDTAGKAKKLKNTLLDIDELNVINTNDDSSGSGSGSGTGGASGSGGKWVQQESIFKKYESDIDNLFDLGRTISDRLSEAMESIDWDAIYEKARNFGKGLADFLNGLITPRLFGDVGMTIASALNTAIYSALSFGANFDWRNLGVSIATGINRFFQTFDFTALAVTLNTWVDGLEDAIGGALETLSWSDIFGGMKDFLSNLEIDTIGVIVGLLTIKKIGKVQIGAAIGEFIRRKVVGLLEGLFGSISIKQIGINFLSIVPMFVGTAGFDGIVFEWVAQIDEALSRMLPQSIGDFIGKFVAGFSTGGVITAGNPIGAVLGGLLASAPIKWFGEGGVFEFDWTMEWFEHAKEAFKTAFDGQRQGLMDIGGWILEGILDGFVGAFGFILEPIYDFFHQIIQNICSIFGINSPAKNMYSYGKYILLGILQGFVNTFTEIPVKIEQFFQKIKSEIESRISSFNDWIKDKFTFNFDFNSMFSLQGNTKGFSGGGRAFATGGFPEDGWFRASHGEMIGQFDDGQSVVANNQQIVDGIKAGVYEGVVSAMNSSNGGGATVIPLQVDGREIFRIVVEQNRVYKDTTGQNAFAY